MQEIQKYNKSTPIKKILKEILWQSYSKHSQLPYELLEEEKELVDNALREMADNIGIIESKTKRFNFICFQNYPSYIKFFDIDREKYIEYYDLKIIDKRYIDLAIDKWLNG